MAIITEDYISLYVSLETAKLLKEKGFLKGIDLRMTRNLSFYDNIGLSHNLNKYYDSLIQDKIDFVVAPTISMTMKWLREVHNLFISVKISIGAYVWTITNTTDYVTVYVDATVGTYEEACEAAIKYCLENLI